MKKNITISCTVASLLIILDSIGAWHMLMMFLFVGIIPGTDSALTPLQMLVLMSTSAGVVILLIGVLPIVRKIKMISVKQNQLVARRLKRV